MKSVLVNMAYLGLLVLNSSVWAQTGSIGGTVTGPDGTTSLSGVTVSVYSVAGFQAELVQTATTNPSGAYLVSNLGDGTYRVMFVDPSGRHLPEIYDDQGGLWNLNPLWTGADVVLVGGSSSAEINASLSIGTRISGTVTAVGGAPLAGIMVEANIYEWFSGWTSIGYESQTDATGHYAIAVETGNVYRISFTDPTKFYANQSYNNAGSLENATDIPVDTLTDVEGVDAVMGAAGTVEGVVTASDGATPIEGVQVIAYVQNGTNWDWVSEAYTGATGAYGINGLPAGTYRIRFFPQFEHLGEFYNDASTVADAIDVNVSPGGVVSGIDVSLSPASQISGKVTALDGITPLQGITAALYRWSGSAWISLWPQNTADTGLSGEYLIQQVPPGTYRVEFRDWSGNYAIEYFEDSLGLGTGTDVIVPLGTLVSGIDASIGNASRISGQVTGSDGTTQLEGIYVTASRWSGSGWVSVSDTFTEADGTYSIGGLGAGSYRISFSDLNDVYSGAYAAEVFDNMPNLDTGADVVVPSEAVLTGINASLGSTAPFGPPLLIGLWQTGLIDWEVRYVGEPGTDYILQEVSSLTNTWNDVGTSFECQAGTNVVPWQVSGSLKYLRLRKYP